MSRLIQLLLAMAVLIIGMSAAAGILLYNSHQSAYWLEHSDKVLWKQSDFHSAIQDMNLGSRGYIATGSDWILENYKSGSQRWPELGDELERLTIDNPTQSRNTRELKDAASKFADVTKRMVESKDSKLVLEQKKAMDVNRRLLKEIVREEQLLLAKRQQHNELYETLSWCVFALQVLLALILLWTIGKTIRTYRSENELEQARELEATRAKLRAMANDETMAQMISGVSDYAIFMLDKNGYVQTWNAGAQKIKGYSAEEILGKHFSIFYGKQDNLEKHLQMELETATREGRYEEENWRVRKDGSRFWANVVITAVRDADGNVIGFGKVTRDLTERREAELSVERARDEAIAANEAKSRFLATVSHEVRTPMAGVIGLVEHISLLSDGEMKELADAALDSSQRLLHILNDLLDASKLQVGAVALENRSFSIRPVIGDVVQLVTPSANKKQLTISAHVDDDVPEFICGDELRVRQVLQNLAFNAVKFTEQGSVSISVERIDHQKKATALKLSVSDTGIGMTPEQLKKIFHPFVQAEDSTTRIYGGTGLGLSICRNLTELMDGEIGVTSHIGEGSTFWVIIPFRDDLCKTK